MLGSAMTSPGTNVSLFMEYFMRSLLGGLHPVAIAVAVIAIGIIFTNFCNSVVFGLMLTPVLLAVANAFNINPVPLMTCFIYAVLIAACTPAASPFAAMLYSQGEWISNRNIAIHSIIASIVVFLAICLVGLPLAHIMF